ncbi:MAG: hypothetical protein QGI29_01450 [Pirellulales bacterium]|nr:hypothetical protein [Pirellulales bacterium]
MVGAYSTSFYTRNPKFEVELSVIGVPAYSAEATSECPLIPGALLQLRGQWKAKASEHILCAHVLDSWWYCHPGTKKGGTSNFDEDDPFNIRDCCLRDISTASRAEESITAKANKLRKLARDHNSKFACLMADTTWLAEKQRAQKQNRDLDLGKGLVAFEANPLKWPRFEGERGSHQHIYALWRFREKSSLQWQHELVSRPLHNILKEDRSLFPEPELFMDYRIIQAGHGAASEAVQQFKAPCEFRGFLIGNPLDPSAGRFVLSPSDLPSEQLTEGKTKLRAWFQWLHVDQIIEGGTRPHLVSMRVDCFLGCHNDLSEIRPVPHCPLGRLAPAQLLFSMNFVMNVASAVKPGAQYKGIVFDHDRPDAEMQLPCDGVDIQNEVVYWVLPGQGGRCIRKSVWDFSKLPAHELAEIDSDDAYKLIGNAFKFDVLGVAGPEDIATLRQDPGTLADRNWESVEWSLPDTELTPCFWLTNRGDDDTQATAKFCWSSLERLRLDLERRSYPTPQRMRAVQDEREKSNDRVIAELSKSALFWSKFNGPSLEELKRPKLAILNAAKTTVLEQKEWLSKEDSTMSKEDQDECHQMIQFFDEGLQLIRFTDWHTIRDEHFFAADKAFFNDLIPRANMLRDRIDHRDQRLDNRLNKVMAELDCGDDPEDESVEDGKTTPKPEVARSYRRDRYGIDLDEFNWPEDCEGDCIQRVRRKPKGFKQAVEQAPRLGYKRTIVFRFAIGLFGNQCADITLRNVLVVSFLGVTSVMV